MSESLRNLFCGTSDLERSWIDRNRELVSARAVFALEHGPWVVRSHKRTIERSLFLSIDRIVCGNINNEPRWL